MTMKRRHEDFIEDGIEELNHHAMTCLTSENYNHAMSYLNQALFKARLMAESTKKSSLLALTFNNLGCFYKRLGQVDHALDYFFQSLVLENKGLNNLESIANTYMNISVLFSLKTEHEQSLRYSLKALNLLKNEFKNNPQLAILIVNCYSRIGFEYKALKMFQQALQSFKSGYEICSKSRIIGLSVRKNFQKLHEETLLEIQKDKSYESKVQKVVENNKKKRRVTSYSPKSTFESHTTTLTQNTSLKPITPKFSEKPGTSNIRRGSVVLPPMEEFYISRKNNLEKSYEIDEVKKKKINSLKLRAQENFAACYIQACWKGYKQRKKYYEMLVGEKIKEAENKARQAEEAVNNLKALAQNPKHILRLLRKKLC
ncbi:hypothetical protein SteCoe_32334 [Stentor coeruleus]|uniref:Uncharacterized protein n=1 Tax=Stentor coeruleus TaxID=5963 RepID=A0A1R2AZ99_9CILI|nr:hypothetical protein SteCoe_32334 [Stentor coeruleus]